MIIASGKGDQQRKLGRFLAWLSINLRLVSMNLTCYHSAQMGVFLQRLLFLVEAQRRQMILDPCIVWVLLWKEVKELRVTATITNLILNIFVTFSPKGNSIPIMVPLSIFSSHQPPTSLTGFLSLWISLFWTFLISGVIQYMAFFVWLLSFVFKVHHAVACISMTYLFMAE